MGAKELLYVDHPSELFKWKGEMEGEAGYGIEGGSFFVCFLICKLVQLRGLVCVLCGPVRERVRT